MKVMEKYINENSLINNLTWSIIEADTLIIVIIVNIIIDIIFIET